MIVDLRGISERTTEKGPDNAGPLNRSGNPRYRLDDVSLVTDLLPLNIRFYRWALFVGQQGHSRG